MFYDLLVDTEILHNLLQNDFLGLMFIPKSPTTTDTMIPHFSMDLQYDITFQCLHFMHSK